MHVTLISDWEDIAGSRCFCPPKLQFYIAFEARFGDIDVVEDGIGDDGDCDGCSYGSSEDCACQNGLFCGS